MAKPFSIIIVFIFIAISCNNSRREDFSLSVMHYGGAAGVTISYNIDEKGLQVSTNCDLEDCEQKTVYKRIFTKPESDSIYEFITSLRLDTLNRFYSTEGIMDGLLTKITFRKGLFTKYSSEFDNFSTTTTNFLFTYIDSLIPVKKYRFYGWGRDD